MAGSITESLQNYCQGFGDCKSAILESIKKNIKMLDEEIQYTNDYDKKGGEWPKATPEQFTALKIRRDTFIQLRTFVKSLKPKDYL